MAFVQYPIPNIDQTIVKPVVVQVLEKIKKDIFYDRNTSMLLVDHTQSVHEIGSTITGKNDNDLLLDTTSKVVVTMTEQVINDIVMGSIVDTDELDTVWADGDVGMYLKPTRPRTEIVLQLNYKAGSKSEVNSWVNNYYNRLAKGLTYTKGDVAYEYTVPDECIAVFHAVWETMEKNQGFGVGLIEYIQKHCKASFDFKTNIAGKGASMVFRDYLTNLSIAVTNETPEPARIEGGAYEATIEVAFKFDKPTIMYQRYPIFVHSNYINPKYFDVKRNRNSEVKEVTRATTGLMADLMALHIKQTTDIYSKDGLIYPEFDDVKLNHGTLALAPLIQAQLGVSEESNRILVDLASFASGTGFELHPELLNYISTVGDDVFVYGNSAVCISIFKNGVRRNPAKYHITQDLKIVSDYDLDLRGRYHLTITILANLELLPLVAMEELAKYGDLLASIIKFLYPTIDNTKLPVPENPDAVPGIDSTEVNINDVYSTLEDLPNVLTYAGGRMFLVNTIAVVTKK